MYVYDLEGGILVAVNDTALALYGYARHEFVGMSVEDLIAPAEMARLRSTVGNLRSGLRSGLSNSGIWSHRRSDGSELDVEITATDHVFEGRAARVVLAFDVTERVEAERLIRVSEARYRDLFENASDLIATVDLDGRVTDVNEAFLRSTGYSREELLELRLEDLIPAGVARGARSRRAPRSSPAPWTPSTSTSCWRATAGRSRWRSRAG